MSGRTAFVMLNLFRHPTRGAGIALASCPSFTEGWTLKQVQGDGYGEWGDAR